MSRFFLRARDFFSKPKKITIDLETVVCFFCRQMSPRFYWKRFFSKLDGSNPRARFWVFEPKQDQTHHINANKIDEIGLEDLFLR